MRCVVVAVLLVACVRDRQPSLWRTPKVGDHASATQRFTATIEGPDGQTHTLENVMELESETLAVDGDYPTRLRMTIVRHESIFDGVTKPGLSGTFELSETSDGGFDAVRVGGTISPEERAFFTTSRNETRKTAGSARRLLQRTFKIGEIIDLKPEEIAGLNFGMSSATLTVVDVKPSALELDIRSVGPIGGVGTLEASGKLRFSEGGGRDLEQDGEIVRDHKRIGKLHIVQRSHMKS